MSSPDPIRLLTALPRPRPRLLILLLPSVSCQFSVVGCRSGTGEAGARRRIRGWWLL